MLKKINNVNIKKRKELFFKKIKKSHIDFFDFFKSNAKQNTPKNNK